MNTLPDSPGAPRPWAIPATLNLIIAAAQLLALPALLVVAGRVPFWPWVPLLALAYALVMNSAY
ncbi:MAG: hypothetical protein NTV51_02770, partial [Verrucomicrobia bacterium]|nr:hypothetical protein [Verrucomicrobiota bacterium]